MSSIRNVRRKANELNVTVDVLDNTLRYGQIVLQPPLWRCFNCNQSHAIYLGWGIAQVCCDRAECCEELLDNLDEGIDYCECEDCCDAAREVYGLSADTPDGIVRDFAKDLGDLPINY